MYASMPGSVAKVGGPTQQCCLARRYASPQSLAAPWVRVAYGEKCRLPTWVTVGK